VEVLTGTAFGSAGRPPATPWQKGAGAVMVSDVLVQTWQAVYREYISAVQTARTEDSRDRAVMARLSADVAALWRQMVADTPDMEWWETAALTTAAEAFEGQAREWSSPTPSGMSPRPTEHTSGLLGDNWFRLPDSNDEGYPE
jgi:hypothetical protein